MTLTSGAMWKPQNFFARLRALGRGRRSFKTGLGRERAKTFSAVGPVPTPIPTQPKSCDLCGFVGRDVCSSALGCASSAL
eukprot:892442-Prymnesium_polylepis.1